MEKFRSHTTSLAVGNKIMVLGGMYFPFCIFITLEYSDDVRTLMLAWLTKFGEFNISKVVSK